jgi:serine phosphatase RsbU (regulator of sigma subunit)/Flp pilus assembly protein TadD
VFTALSFGVYGQSHKEDSLTALIVSTNNVHEKVQRMSDLWDEYAAYDGYKALDLAHQSLKISVDDFDIMFSYNQVGMSYRNVSEFDSAMFYFQRAYQLGQDLQDTSYLSKVANNLGAVYFDIGEYDLGLEYLEKSAEYAVALKDVEQASAAYTNIGGIYILLKELDKAEEFTLIGLELASQNEFAQEEANAQNALGAIAFKRGEFDKGKSWYVKAIDTYTKINDIEGIRKSYQNLAYSYRTEGKNKIAEVYYLKALEYADSSSSAEGMQKAYKGLAYNNEDMKKYSRALDYFKLYMDWSDSVRNNQNDRVLIEMQERFSSEQTAKENEILQQENQIKDLAHRESQAQLNQSRIMVVSSAIGLVLLIVLALALFNRNRLKQRANLELQNAHDIIQEKNEDITASIEYASKIQEALLPTKETEGLFRDSFFILRPKDIVSGDFLWYSKVGRKVVFTAADCTGHGVPGAFMSMIGNTYLHQIVNEKKVLQPSLILDELREMVVQALSQQGGEDARKDGMDMSLCVLDLDTNILEFSGANNPLYYVKSGDMLEVKGDKQPVGYMPERNGKFTNNRIQLAEGDAIYIFSDGYADQFGGPRGKKFKYKQMRDLLYLNRDKDMLEQKQVMIDAFMNWKGNLEQIDDVCFIGVRV